MITINPVGTTPVALVRLLLRDQRPRPRLVLTELLGFVKPKEGDAWREMKLRLVEPVFGGLNVKHFRTFGPDFGAIASKKGRANSRHRGYDLRSAEGELRCVFQRTLERIAH